MFCEKCGNKMNEGEKFCEKCGTPVSTPVVNTADAPAQEAVNNTVPRANTVVNNAVPQPTAVPKPPRQPMSPKTKKAIMFSSIGAGVVVITLIVLFAFVLPMLNRVKVQDFIKVDFSSDLYKGHTSATFSVDLEEFYNKYFNDGKSVKEKIDDYAENYDVESLLSDLGSNYQDSLSGGSDINAIITIVQNCDVSAEIKSASDKNEENKADEDKDEEYKSYDVNTSATVYDLKGDEVVVVKLRWNKDEDSIKAIKEAEKKAGISFDTTDATIEIKIADELEKNNLKLEEAEEVDIMDYIEANNLARTKGIEEGELSLNIDNFEYEVGDYKLVFEKSEYLFDYSADKNDLGKIHILKKDETLEDYDSDSKDISVTTDEPYDSHSTGDEVTVKIASMHILGTNIYIKSSSKTFEIKANEPLNTDTARKNIDELKKGFNKIVENNPNISDLSIRNIYFFEPKDESQQNKNMIDFVCYCNYKSRYGEASKQYIEYVFTDVSLSGENMDYDKDLLLYNSSLKSLEENSSFLKGDYPYTKVKIQ